MDSAIFIKGCQVKLRNESRNVVLDPCRCSTYYKLKENAILPERKLMTCDTGLLWNHKASQCQKRAVIAPHICNPREPWERCMDKSETFKAEIKQTCIAEGSFIEQSTTSTILSREAQLANIELAMASMVAGSVITLMFVAILWAFCDKDKIRLPHKVWRLLRERQKKEKPKPVVTEGDNISVVYEDIDEEETVSTGYMAPEVRGVNIATQPAMTRPNAVPSSQLVINKGAVCPSKTPPPKPKNALASVEVRQYQEPEGQDVSLRKAPVAPPKVKPATSPALKMVPKSVGSSPRLPQKSPLAVNIAKPKTPAPVPPKKPMQTLTEDENYIHAVSP